MNSESQLQSQKNVTDKKLLKGIGGRRSLKDEMKNFNNVVEVMQGGHVEVKRTRGRDKGKRTLAEAAFRKDVVKFLHGHMFRYWRIENLISGKHGNGIPDFLFFTNDKFYFLELKSNKGSLQEYQVEFKRLCETRNVNHIVARTIDDIREGIK